VLLDEAEPALAILRFEHGRAFALEHPAYQPAHDRLVVDDQDEISPDPRTGGSGRRAGLGHWRRRILEC
jgi:hypothetical protein